MIQALAEKFTSTADLCDVFEDNLQYAQVARFRSFGKRKHFHGPIATVRCLEDNSVVKQILNSPGHGRVLVVDGGASELRALVGDQIAKSAIVNGWEGLLVNGCIRDSKEIATLDIGVMALGTCPRKTKKMNSGSKGHPVEFGGVVFVPGMYLVADEDGVVVADPGVQPASKL